MHNSRWRTVLQTRVGDEVLDARIGAGMAFLCAAALLLAGLQKVTGVAETRYELLVGTLLVLTLSMLLFFLGWFSAWHARAIGQQRDHVRDAGG